MCCARARAHTQAFLERVRIGVPSVDACVPRMCACVRRKIRVSSVYTGVCSPPARAVRSECVHMCIG